MNRTEKGVLGEAKALAHLVASGYEVFLPFKDNGLIDLIAFKDGNLLKVSVKSTSQESPTGYAVSLKTVSRRKDNEVVVHPFDNTQVDLLVVYIIPLDKIIVLDAKSITTKNRCTVAS